ncbi:hypothetical protein Syun_008734 [Stephania yunnanensis]|uniref:Protein kinase domain-containing protein n=1 Tax=Stephania yunnanensis TaxID=152371 RepID=A0AAP0KEB7_9MAGN
MPWATMPRQDPWTDHGAGHPEPVGLGWTELRHYEHVPIDQVVKTIMEPSGSKGRKQLGGYFEYYMGRRATPLPDHRWWCPASIGGPFQPTVWTTMRVEVVVTPPLPFLSYCASTMPSPTTSLLPVAATRGGLGRKKSSRNLPTIALVFIFHYCKVKGTPRYMSPEAIASIRRGSLCDIWALGCVVVEMLCEQSTFSIKPGESLEDFLDRIGFGGESPRIPVGISREAQDFLKRCFVKNSKSRWNASTLLSHPFLKDHIPNAE